METILAGVGVVSFIGYLIWLIVRSIQWESKIPPIIGMLLSVIMFVGGVSMMPGIISNETDGEKSQTEENLDETKNQEETNPSNQNESRVFSLGETWEVNGQWALTVLGATETEDRNQYSEKNPAAVYVIDYTYENIGYLHEDLDGLFFGLDDETIVDNTGLMGYSYPGDIVNYAKRTPVGARCNAQACIGVDNPGNFNVTVSKYDGNGDKQSATFHIAIS